MKKLSILMIGLLAIVSVNAQRKSSVMLTVIGNTNPQVLIDGTSYNLSSTASTGRSVATVSDLATGQHTLVITRGSQYNNNRTDDFTTTFNLRNRFDMHINLNADGSLELVETARMRNAGGNQARISNSDFNTLWQNVRAQRTGELRRVAVSNAFTNRANTFTTSQVVQLIQLVPSEGARLQLAKQSYAYVSDPVNFSRVETLFADQTNRDDLDLYVTNYNNTDGNANVYTGAVYAAMTDANFNNLYQNIRQLWPATARYNSLAEAFNNGNNYFTTTQATQLIKLQSSEATRLALAKMAYRGIIDTYNYSQVYNLFNYQSSKDELAAYVANYKPGTVITNTTIRVAMSEYDFNAMLQDVRSRFLPFEKMNTLTGIFNNTSNYFTTAQAKQLIELVSSESNRLQLAKSAYRNVVDRSNYRTMYDLLNSQSSRSELDAYIAAYRD